MSYFESAIGTLLLIVVLLASVELTMWAETKVVMHQMARDAMSVVQVEGCLPEEIEAAIASQKSWGLKNPKLTGAPHCADGQRVPFGQPIELALQYTYEARLPIISGLTNLASIRRTDNSQIALRSMSQWRPTPAPVP